MPRTRFLIGLILILSSFFVQAASDLWIPAWGAWLGGTDDNSTEIESQIGRQLDVLHFYNAEQTNLTSSELTLINAGRKLLINFIPSTNWSWAVGTANGGKSSVDQAMTNFANSVASIKPAEVMLAVLGEQERYVTNGGGNATPAGTAAQYAQMSQNVWNIFKARGATNVIWCWDVGGGSLNNLYVSLWPGNNYVDWVMWDPYQDSSLSITNKILSNYNWFTANSTSTANFLSKQWGLAEWGIGLNTNWVPTVADQTNAYNALNYAVNTYQLPRLLMLALFDESYSVMLAGAAPAYSNFANSIYMKQQQNPTNAPVITQQPAAVTNYAGTAPRFSVAAAGSAPMHYQWQTNNVSFAGATNNSLMLLNAQLSWNGVRFTCLVTNSFGSITSTPAVLTVVAPAGYVGSVLADAPVAYWRLDETSGTTVHDLVGPHDGTASASVVLGDTSATPHSPLTGGGDSDACMGFNGTDGSVMIPFYPELNQRVFTIECWSYDVPIVTNTELGIVCSRVNSNPAYDGYMLYQDPGTSSFYDYTYSFWVGNGHNPNPWSFAFNTADLIVNKAWTHIVASYDGANMYFYLNGSCVSTNSTDFVTNGTRFVSAGVITNGVGTQGDMSIGDATSGTSGASYFAGEIDEVAYYGFCLSPQRVMTHYLMAGFGNRQTPIVLQDIASKTVQRGAAVTLSPVIEASVPMTYQWFKGSAAVAGAGGIASNAPIELPLAITNMQSGNAGNYVLMVTNSAGWTNTSTAALTLPPPPNFSSGAFSKNSPSFQLNYSGPAGYGYRIWASANPALTPIESTWTLLTNTAFSGGAENFMDTAATNFQRRFYILSMP